MPPVDLLQYPAERGTFRDEPFRVQVSDGGACNIHHPELVTAGVGSVIVGIPAAGQTRSPHEHYESIALSYVVKLISMTTPATSGKGQWRLRPCPCP